MDEPRRHALPGALDETARVEEEEDGRRVGGTRGIVDVALEIEAAVMGEDLGGFGEHRAGEDSRAKGRSWG